MSDVHLMTTARLMTTASGCHFQSKPSCGFPAPSINDFFFKPAFSIGGVGFTKPILLMLLSAAIVLVVFWLAFRKPKRVPRGVQNVGELGILFIRDRTQQLQGIVISSLSKCQPSVRFVVVRAHAVGAIRMLAFSCRVEHRVKLIHRVLGRSGIA